MSGRAGPADAVAPALPVAAAAAVLVARLLPLHFTARENTLGIVSWATLNHYPQQQEMAWLLLSGGLALLVCWVLARWLAARPRSARRQAGVEALAAASLLAALWLPTAPAALLAPLAAAAALLLATRAGSGPRAAEPLPRPPQRRLWGFALLALLVAAALTPTLWQSLGATLHGVDDDWIASDSFTFLGEIGQHLAWANAIDHGRFQGRDFFCLYGPLFDLSAVGFWRLAGRSVASWELWFALTRALGLWSVLLLGGTLLRPRALAFAALLLVPWANLRVGLALIGLALLGRWLERGGLGRVAAAGAVAGLSLLYSQEFGLAFTLVAAIVFLLRRALRQALVFASALALVAAPVLTWFAANGALAAMLHDMVSYPGYIVAGYAKLPFPSLAAHLPLLRVSPRTPADLFARLAYAAPAICLGALLLALPVSALDPRRPAASLAGAWRALRGDPRRSHVAAVAVFGLLAFRSALGRSDITHLLPVLPVAALLLLLACERSAALWRAAAPARVLAAQRGAALALLLAHAGLVLWPTPLANLVQSARAIRSLPRAVLPPQGMPQVVRVARWAREATAPGEPILFLPNDGAAYYLADRPDPIRFVMGHQIVTEAHRAEVLAALRANPPRYVVWDDAADRVDGLPDELVLGAPLLAWIRENYQLERVIGRARVLRWRGAAYSGPG